MTLEQQTDIDTRITQFTKDYQELVTKHQIDFYCYPQFIPTKEGTFSVIPQMRPIDTKYAPTISPIQPEPIIKKWLLELSSY